MGRLPSLNEPAHEPEPNKFCEGGRRLARQPPAAAIPARLAAGARIIEKVNIAAGGGFIRLSAKKPPEGAHRPRISPVFRCKCPFAVAKRAAPMLDRGSDQVVSSDRMASLWFLPAQAADPRDRGARGLSSTSNPPISCSATSTTTPTPRSGRSASGLLAQPEFRRRSSESRWQRLSARPRDDRRDGRGRAATPRRRTTGAPCSIRLSALVLGIFDRYDVPTAIGPTPGSAARDELAPQARPDRHCTRRNRSPTFPSPTPSAIST